MFFDWFKRGKTDAPMRMNRNEQAFTPGPGPGPGLHSSEFRYEPGLGAPPVPGHSMMRSYGNQSWTIPQVDPHPFQRIGLNNGYGALVTGQSTVQTIEVKQWSNALFAPTRERVHIENPTRTLGDENRAVMQHLAAPIRPQSIPGYVVTQAQVTNSGINANQVSLHRNLRAPKRNEAQSAMC